MDETSGSGRIRASDAERERVARFLATAFAEGRLDIVEYDTRVAAAYAAVYRDELTPLIDDLPAPDRPLFGTKPAVPAPASTPPRILTPRSRAAFTPYDRRRAPGWPVVVIMIGTAMCLARFGLFGPLAVLLVLVAAATALGWIADETDRRGRRPRR